LGIVGIVVFLLTEDVTYKMTLVDRWTVVDVVIFMVEIMVIALIIKRGNKDTIKEEEEINL